MYIWTRLENKPYWLKAIPRDWTSRVSVGVSHCESNLKEIQTWCQNNNCGTRMSYDMFRFGNDQEISAFLLRWS